MTRLKKITPVAVALVGLFWLLGLGVSAGGSVISVSHPGLDFGSVDVGTKQDFTISITNLVDRPVVVDVVLEDQGNLGDTYLKPTPNPLELPPNAQGDVILSLEVPTDAHAGKYSAGILFIAEAEAEEGLTAALVAAVGAEVKFRIEGVYSEVFTFDAEVGVEPVRLLVNLSNFNEDRDLTGRVEITIEDVASGQIVASFSGQPKLFKRSGGIQYWEFTRDSGAYPPGDYLAKARLYVEGSPGEVIKVEGAFQLGFRQGALVDPGKGLTVLESSVQAGKPIQWYVTLTNQGTLPLHFRIRTRLRDDQGNILLNKQVESTIPPGETRRIDFEAPNLSQGFPTSLGALRLVFSGSRQVSIETLITFANDDEITRLGEVAIIVPLQIRIMVLSVLGLVLAGIVGMVWGIIRWRGRLSHVS